MTEIPTEPIDREALEWFVRMRDEPVSADDRRAFRRWLDRDAGNALALARAEALWNRFDVMQPEIDRIRRPEPVFNRRSALLGGAVLLASGAGLYAVQRSGLFADYVTDIGERRSFTLADGSIVELGSYSALSVDFTAAERRLSLHRGQAFFDVAADAARPFTVAVASGTTQALGTKFDLKYVDDLVTVTVSERAVSVRAAARPALVVKQGWQVSYGDRVGLGAVVEADLAATDAWRHDRIVFQDVPLRRVLAELERYRRGRIVLMDRNLGDTPVTAIFDVGKADRALQTISDVLPLRILQVTKYVTVVYST